MNILNNIRNIGSTKRFASNVKWVLGELWEHVGEKCEEQLLKVNGCFLDGWGRPEKPLLIVENPTPAGRLGMF